MPRLCHRLEQRRQILAEVRGVQSRIIEQARRRAGLERQADVGLDRLDVAYVPGVRRDRQVVSVKNRDLDPAVLDRGAPVGAVRISVRRGAEVVDRLLQAAAAALFVLDAVGDDEQTFCGVSLAWLVPFPGLGM
jgi:hypothetical protein